MVRFITKDDKVIPINDKGLSSEDVKLTKAQRETLFSKPSLRKKEVGVFGADLRNVNTVIDDQGNFTVVPFSRERLPLKPELILKLRKERILKENEKQNVLESFAHILRVFPEGIGKVERVEREMDSRSDSIRYKIELVGGVFTGDFDRLRKQGIDVMDIHATKKGTIAFEVDIPKNLRQSSPKKEKKIEFAMKNIELPHIKKGIMEITSGNTNVEEQEMLMMQFESKRTGTPLTKKQKDRIAEIERMADPHEIGLAESPFRRLTS